MANYGYPSREPTFEDYYRSVPRSGMEPKETRQTVEEMYRRGGSSRSPPAGKGYSSRRYYDERDGSDSEEDVVIRRRQVRRARARSASTDRARPKRRSSLPPTKEGREMVRYQSRSRRQPQDAAASSDEEKTVCYSDEEQEEIMTKKKGCGSHCGKEAPVFSMPPSFRHPHPDEDYDSDADLHERKKRRNKRMLYTGLAAVGTLATCNGIYQNQKAFRARRQALDTQNPDCAAEARALKKKAITQDMFAVGVVAIGLNNVRLAWARQQALKKEDMEAAAKWREHKDRRPASAGPDPLYLQQQYEQREQRQLADR